ncbi:hypothetical protein HPB51_003465 [Rhipicephalus microplus]|uniref:Cytochrome n=1 Tax=Rhipicephalus microplus TaxID=6941 RepID=A0A9J6EEU7_RHIMP|nr:hypothetical protein HPB51_003465 [Rhipicephalus microplus]
MDCVALAGALLVASLLYLGLHRCLWGKKSPRGNQMPPGPPGYPLVGHPQFMYRDFHCNQAMKWAKQYGPVYRIKTGPTDMVILNDFQSIKKFFTKREILYRPVNWLFRGTVHGVQYLSIHHPMSEKYRKNECRCIIEEVAEARGEPITFHDYLLTSTSNNISALVYGSRYPFGHPRRRFLNSLLSDLFKAIFAGSLVEFVPPFLLEVVSKLPFLRQTAIVSKLWKFIEDAKTQIKEHEATLDEHVNRDFIDGYLKKINENEADPNSHFEQRYLLGNVLSFFIAGSNSVAATLQWHFINLADKPDTVQSRIFREIDEVVGRERPPAWEDRNRMPYTMACIWEMYRWTTMSPLGVPRSAGEDTFFDDYYIPKGTTISPNVWAVHNDPTLWKEPSRFNPDRFLREDGSLIQPRPEYLIPFSIGKRMCPGEILASVEIFLYLTSLVQKYRILPEGDKLHDLEAVNMPLAELFKRKVRFVHR